MNYNNKEFVSKKFSGVDFTGESFQNSIFDRCVFEECNLSNINLNDTRFQDVVFKNCKLLGLNFTKCNRFAFSFDFEECLIKMCVFSELYLKSTKFEGSDVIDCDFMGANLYKASFENSDLDGSLFHKNDLSHASFKGAVNYNIDPNQNTFKKTKFSIPEATRLLSIFDIELE